MDVIFYFITVSISQDAPSFFFALLSPLVVMLLGNIWYRARKYIYTYTMPEDRPVRPHERWWSGLIFSTKVLLETVPQLLLLIPVLLGLVWLLIIQNIHLFSFEALFGEGDPGAGVMTGWAFGIALVFIGESFWRKRLEEKYDSASWILFSLAKVDVYALFFLCGASALSFALSLVSDNPNIFYIRLVSILTATVSLAMGVFGLANPILLKPPEDREQTRQLWESGFRFSKAGGNPFGSKPVDRLVSSNKGRFLKLSKLENPKDKGKENS